MLSWFFYHLGNCPGFVGVDIEIHIIKDGPDYSNDFAILTSIVCLGDGVALSANEIKEVNSFDGWCVRGCALIWYEYNPLHSQGF